MKKFISVIIAAVMAFCMFIPALAADKAKFGVTLVSEDDSKAVVSVDYNGGSTFNCLDFEVKLSGRLKVEKCENGAGLRNFKIYVDDLNTEDATLSSFNKDSNPIAFTFATTADFKAVNGKDLLVITLKKTTKDKLTADDVKLTVTNCGVSSASGGADPIGTSITQLGEKTDGGDDNIRNRKVRADHDGKRRLVSQREVGNRQDRQRHSVKAQRQKEDRDYRGCCRLYAACDCRRSCFYRQKG